MGENKFNLICETINSGVFVMDKDYTIKFWNQWLIDHTNIEADAIIGSSLLDFFPQINQKSFDRKIKTSLRIKGPTFFNVSKDGYLLQIKLNNIMPSIFKYMQQNVTILPYNIEENEVIVYIYDNTALCEVNYKLQVAKEELEEKNKQLQEQNQRFERLLNSTLEGLLVSDASNIITNVNDACVKLFDVRKKEQLIGRNIFELIDRGSLSLVKENIQKEVAQPYEINLIKNDGSIFPALVAGKSMDLYSSQHRISAVIDLTDIKEKEKHLFEQSKLVSMGEMIGNIAHQWRQPLTVISTKATGILMEKEYGLLNDEKLEQHCQDINTNAQYLSQTIDDFKDFIKGDKQKVDFSLSKEIEALLHLVESNTKNLHIQVFTNLDDEIRLFGYPNELKQSMINIFNNAKDALENIDENERLLFINTYKKDKYIYISIKDNANGIPEAIIGKIFEPYFTTKHQSQGTGLGLHMSYNLIKEGLHGKIIASNVTYEYNEKSYKGAEFKIKIPILY
jgi:PAS domain S-box-containing protein